MRAPLLIAMINFVGWAGVLIILTGADKMLWEMLQNFWKALVKLLTEYF